METPEASVWLRCPLCLEEVSAGDFRLHVASGCGAKRRRLSPSPTKTPRSTRTSKVLCTKLVAHRIFHSLRSGRDLASLSLLASPFAAAFHPCRHLRKMELRSEASVSIFPGEELDGLVSLSLWRDGTAILPPLPSSIRSLSLYSVSTRNLTCLLRSLNTNLRRLSIGKLIGPKQQINNARWLPNLPRLVSLRLQHSYNTKGLALFREILTLPMRTPNLRRLSIGAGIFVQRDLSPRLPHLQILRFCLLRHIGLSGATQLRHLHLSLYEMETVKAVKYPSQLESLHLSDWASADDLHHCTQHLESLDSLRSLSLVQVQAAHHLDSWNGLGRLRLRRFALNVRSEPGESLHLDLNPDSLEFLELQTFASEEAAEEATFSVSLSAQVYPCLKKGTFSCPPEAIAHWAAQMLPALEVVDWRQCPEAAFRRFGGVEVGTKFLAHLPKVVKERRLAFFFRREADRLLYE